MVQDAHGQGRKITFNLGTGGYGLSVDERKEK